MIAITEGTGAVKLPGGCELEEPGMPEDLRKINIRQINIIPFKRYRFDVPEQYDDMYDPDDPDLLWKESTPGELVVPLLITLATIVPLLYRFFVG